MKNADMPAMPITLNPGEVAAAGMYLDGLTKREYIAAMAMQGLSTREGYSSPAMVAHDAVAYADSLLAELDKRGGV